MLGLRWGLWFLTQKSFTNISWDPEITICPGSRRSRPNGPIYRTVLRVPDTFPSGVIRENYLGSVLLRLDHGSRGFHGPSPGGGDPLRRTLASNCQRHFLHWCRRPQKPLLPHTLPIIHTLSMENYVHCGSQLFGVSFCRFGLDPNPEVIILTLKSNSKWCYSFTAVFLV